MCKNSVVFDFANFLLFGLLMFQHAAIFSHARAQFGFALIDLTKQSNFNKIDREELLSALKFTRKI